MDAPRITEEEEQAVYNWVDNIPLSRPKKNIARDFSDGVLAAEIVKHLLPKLVEIHNYIAAHSVEKKKYNWNTLNEKVFRKLRMKVSKNDINQIVTCASDAIVRVLKVLKDKIDNYRGGLVTYGSKEFCQSKISLKTDQQDHKKVKESSLIQDYKARLEEKDQIIWELRETLHIMELKVKKMEELLAIKDAKIESLTSRQSRRDPIKPY